MVARSVYTNTAPTGAFRGVSGPYLVFALERHMDHIALELGMDRREFRLGALAHDGDAMLNGQVLEDASILAEAFAAVEDRAPWAELSKGPNRGVGIAATVWLTNPMPGQAQRGWHSRSRDGSDRQRIGRGHDGATPDRS